MKNTLAARAAAVTRRHEDQPEPAADVEQLPAAPARRPRVQPVKLTVELLPGAYRQVKQFPDEMGIPEATGKARIPTVEVFRALLEELADDVELRQRVAARITENLGS